MKFTAANNHLIVNAEEQNGVLKIISVHNKQGKMVSLTDSDNYAEVERILTEHKRNYKQICE